MVVNIAYDPDVGGSFLTWSLYFLSGKDNYFDFKRNNVVELIPNPLSKINAHKFLPNSIDNFDLWLDLIKNKNINNDDLHVFNVHPGNNIDVDEMNQMINFYDKNIIVTVPNEHRFYHQTYDKRTPSKKFSDPESRTSDWDELHKDFVDHFFEDAKQKWEELGLDNIWDKREFLALNLRPKEEQKITDYIENINKDMFYLDSRDLWYSLDYSIVECFEWLDIKIDNERYNKWLPIYQKWKQFHYNRVQFGWYFEKIISAIINNDYIDLQRFKLDIIQEAVIQHELIYRYNLNLKTYKLEKFTDTMQLHSILEENIHPVDNIYYP